MGTLKKEGKIIGSFGCEEWYKNGKLHREDGPALTNPDGTKQWFKHGIRHREDGPAIEYRSGEECWYKDGELHREDGPSVIHDDGSFEWYKNGELHREGGPAFKNFDGELRWYKNGKLHREDGPAIDKTHSKSFYEDEQEFMDCVEAMFQEDKNCSHYDFEEWKNETKLWFLNDVKYSEKDYKEKIKK